MKAAVVLLVCLLAFCSVEAKSKVAASLKAVEKDTVAETAQAQATTTTTTTTAAENKAENKAEDKQDTVSATQLSNGGDSNCGCAGSDPSQQQTSGCGCGSGVSYVNNVGGGGGFSNYEDMQERERQNMGPRPRVDDALRPIDDWLNDFTKRTNLMGGLWEAARATVQPLLKRLERTQQEAMDRLRDSNRAIRDHVEDAATQHIYNLLRSKRALDDAEMAAQEKKQRVHHANEMIKRAEADKQDAVDSSKQMQDAYKKEKELAQKNKVPGAKKDNTTDTIMSHIAKILAEK